jgi:lipopolysaccharide export LptBFGC system permease protein LptF
VMVRFNDSIMFARRARVVNGGRNGLLLILQDGQIVSGESNQKPGMVRFSELRLPAPNDQGVVPPTQARRENNRQSLNILFATALQSANSQDRLAARSGLAARFAAAFAMPLLPFLAIGLGIPPKRQSGALGIGLGLITVVAFVQGIHAFEDSALPSAPLSIALIWAGLASISYWSWRCHTELGPGYIEERLNHIVQPILDRVAGAMSMATKSQKRAADFA